VLRVRFETFESVVSGGRGDLGDDFLEADLVVVGVFVLSGEVEFVGVLCSIEDKKLIV
jgi:hypothetical protein